MSAEQPVYDDRAQRLGGNGGSIPVLITDTRHCPRVDEYGVWVCDTCTVTENRRVGDDLVHMYWDHGNCPGYTP
jgi:hypothetical protein